MTGINTYEEMTTNETYRMGTFLVGEDNRPSINELGEALNDEFIERDSEEINDGEKELVYKDKGRNVWIQESDDVEKEYDYCHFRYVTDTKESYRVRTDDDEEKDENETRLADSRVMYFRNGQFVFESSEDLEDFWIPRFIGRVLDYKLEGSDYRLYNLGEEYMHDAYNNHDIVTKLRLEEPRGDSGEVSDEVGEFIRDLAGEVTSFEFSSGGNGNLKNKASIDKCAQNLGIRRMNAKNEDDYMKTFSGSSINKSWDAGDTSPDNMEAQVRRESLAVRNAIQEELERLMRIYE